MKDVIITTGIGLIVLSLLVLAGIGVNWIVDTYPSIVIKGTAIVLILLVAYSIGLAINCEISKTKPTKRF